MSGTLKTIERRFQTAHIAVRALWFVPLCLALCFCLTACADPKGARRALEDDGLSDIVVTGPRFFGCNENDTYRTGFEATNIRGKHVTGVVCSAWLKNSTIRYD